ncbi:hypothetical protein INR49_032327 [Caranx melampygus]|nr:hypothetical protein INR49_032327 [Caranx melampygus]
MSSQATPIQGSRPVTPPLTSAGSPRSPVSNGRLVQPRVQCLVVCVNIFPALKAMASSRHRMEAATSLSTSQTSRASMCLWKVTR